MFISINLALSIWLERNLCLEFNSQKVWALNSYQGNGKILNKSRVSFPYIGRCWKFMKVSSIFMVRYVKLYFYLGNHLLQYIREKNNQCMFPIHSSAKIFIWKKNILNAFLLQMAHHNVIEINKNAGIAKN